jgi:long-subunit acyl-CoA synthetase (AMP-forming)
MQIINSKFPLKETVPNMATMLYKNASRFADRPAVSEKVNGEYRAVNWSEFVSSIENIASNLRPFGFDQGSKMMIYSKNRTEMLMLELAVMASGGVAVPVFFNYNSETVNSLYKQSDATFAAVGSVAQLEKLGTRLDVKHIFIFDEPRDKTSSGLTPFDELLRMRNSSLPSLRLNANPNEVCLNMFTSGTMGKQKCVQLTHRNILSQQAALQNCFHITENDRFLSYLRWHHSFGGIFEIFNALYNGASIALESSCGLNPAEMMENWKLVQPTAFFSVPLIYQALIDLIGESNAMSDVFFHPELKFVFTAAAPLPKYISDEFAKRNIPVVEGWGLTETAPCCTITDASAAREPGIVGSPIAGVSIRIDDEGELQVKGPNVMPGYYNDPESNSRAFTDDGWFRTGDIGEITDKGVKLITRKDRIFKLANAEKIIPTEIETLIAGKCHYVAHVLVEGSGRNRPVALLFPDRLAFKENTQPKNIGNCTCPQNLEQFAQCLENCLCEINNSLGQKFSRIKAAMLIDDDLKIDNRTLTPSMKLVPEKVKEVYKANIERLYNPGVQLDCNFYLIELEM